MGIGYIFLANEANFGGDSGAGAAGGDEGITGAWGITGAIGSSSLLLLLSGGVGSLIGGDGEGGLIFMLDFFFKFFFDGEALFGWV